MIQLNAGNVLLKPSHRKQVLSSLRRANRLGDRLGHFNLNFSITRSGRFFEVNAEAHHSSADFTCRARRHDWQHAVQEVVHQLVNQLHTQWMLRSAVG